MKYHVNAGEFMNHPVIGAELAKEGVDVRKASAAVAKRGPAVSKFEGAVERVYQQHLYTQCQHGLDRKERAKEAEIGLFGIGTDWDKVEKIKGEVIESCEELKGMGFTGR